MIEMQRLSLPDHKRRHAAHAWKEAIVGLLFPRRCVMCGVDLDDRLLCNACAGRIDYIPDNARATCGRWISPHTARRTCAACARHKLEYVEAAIVGHYKSPLKDIVLMAKNASTPAASVLANLMVDSLTRKKKWPAFDVIACVPIHWRTWLARGYNHAALLAEGVARARKLPFSRNALRKERHTVSQTRLSATDRFKNVRGAFSARKKYVDGKRVLLVDNMITTGATANECARVLLKAGAKSVYVVAAARGGA